MVGVNERERQLLEKIASRGQATKIAHDELRVARDPSPNTGMKASESGEILLG
jgi:hypothetical protein